MNGRDHLTSEECTAWWELKLSPERLLEVSDHLQQCAACRKELLVARRAKALPTDVGYDDLVAWMQGDLDPMEKRELKERLAVSPRASAELADLERFREEMDQMPAHDYSIAEATRSRSGWILPIAAGLAVSLAFLWWNNTQSGHRGVALQDGGKRIVVQEDGTVPSLGVLPKNLRRAVKDSISLGQIAVSPTVTKLKGTTETLAGSSEAAKGFRVVDPVGTLVETRQPTLHWTVAEGASAYRVNLVWEKGRSVLSSAVLDGQTTEWKPEQPLQPNETYEWEVEALHDGKMIDKSPAPPEPEARFAVLPNDERAELERLRSEFGRSHLVMGLAYARAGLLPQAENELEELAKENPQSDLVKRLRASLTNAHP